MIVANFKSYAMNLLGIFLIFFFVILRKIQCRIEEKGKILVYNDFDDYKNFNNKSYDRPFEEIRCRKSYEANCQKIREHNRLYKDGKIGFQLRANCFADLNSKAYLKSHARLVPSVRVPIIDRDAEIVGSSLTKLQVEIPDSFDWREKGFRTKPDNQKSCGSCYAFSIAQSIEGQVFKRTGKLMSLSFVAKCPKSVPERCEGHILGDLPHLYKAEQQIVDCSIRSGNKGCSGGSLRNTLKYLKDFGGIMRRKDYPYRAKEGFCRFARELAVVKISSWAILPRNDEEAMRVAVATIGPVAVSINASPQTFQLYSDGVYDDPKCSSDIVNHAMLVVGYTPDYWIMKNWWGENWGADGYMKIRRNKNLCGLANYAAYAVV